MAQPQQQQSDRLKFQKKKIKDQSQEIKEQQDKINEWIKQQQDPRHNQW
jgi:hypothetical protein|tara:strand:+ start:635 stop:781 length:147 start_codon:yes stop_codon:yes gene_type:complete